MTTTVARPPAAEPRDATVFEAATRSAPVEADPREAMRAQLPRVLQGPLTWLTGKPHDAQVQRFVLRPIHHVLGTFVSMTVGVATTTVALVAGPAVLAIVGLAITVHGLRNARTVLLHQASHVNLFGRSRLDRVFGEFIAAVTFSSSYSEYRHEHIREHHSRLHMTSNDPTVVSLDALGLRRGTQLPTLRRRLRRSLVSPVVHARLLAARARSQRKGLATAAGRAGLACSAALTAGLAWRYGWAVTVVAWFVPLTVGLQMTGMLRLVGEHVVPPPGPRLMGKSLAAGYTNAVFLGEAPPRPRARDVRWALAWVRWWGRMLLVHFPSRYLVFTGDTPVHDFHHRHPRSPNWANALYARQRDLDVAGRDLPAYTEVWSAAAATDALLRSLAAASPEVANPEDAS